MNDTDDVHHVWVISSEPSKIHWSPFEILFNSQNGMALSINVLRRRKVRKNFENSTLLVLHISSKKEIQH